MVLVYNPDSQNFIGDFIVYIKIGLEVIRMVILVIKSRLTKLSENF